MNSAKSSKPSSTGRFRATRAQATRRDTSPKRAPFGLSLRSIDFGGLLGSIPRSVWGFLAFALVVGFAVWAFESALDRPTVYKSYLTHKCVRVVNADGSPGDCRNLPDSYHNVWVY